jgi:trk system potassium uptake protein TrkH
VDWRASLSLVGTVVKWLTVALVFPLALAVYYGRGVPPIAGTMLVAVAAGYGLERLDDDPDLGAREGFLMVALTWLAVNVVGALPYVLAGNGTVAMPVNALFESMSGFTTTGATVMGDISFDTHSRALMMWRQETQWLGGMGIVVLAVAILPELSVGGAQLMDAEAPGPGIEKLTPRIAETARTLWQLYAAITAIEIVLLYGLHLAGFAPNVDLYDAVAHGLTTMPTGGFSPEARSIEAFSAAVQWLVIPFMIAAGVNFALFWRVVSDSPKAPLRDAEFRFYAGVIGSVTAVLAALLFVGAGLEGPNGTLFAGDLHESVRHATFQAVSIVTTTGYASTDFNTWNATAQYVLLFAMFLGGSAGSTGGSVKMVRWLVILKSLRRELFTTVHPEAVRPVRLAGRALDESAIRGIYAFTLLYVVLFAVGVALVALDTYRVGFPIAALDVTSAVAATIGNVGPGFGAVGPMNSYLDFPATSKLIMVFLMWIGRLEIFPVLVLLTRAYWRS